MSEPQRVAMCKGNTFLQIKERLRRTYGEELLERVIARCQPENQTILRGIILSSQFYPEAAFADLLDGTRREVGPEAFRSAARESAKQQIGTVLKTFLSLFVSPKRLTDNNPKLWRALHDSGRLEAEHGADGHSKIVRVSDFDFLCRAYEEAFVEYHCGILELTGAKQVKGLCRRVGPQQYEMIFRWQ